MGQKRNIYVGCRNEKRNRMRSLLCWTYDPGSKSVEAAKFVKEKGKKRKVGKVAMSEMFYVREN